MMATEVSKVLAVSRSWQKHDVILVSLLYMASNVKEEYINIEKKNGGAILFSFILV